MPILDSSRQYKFNTFPPNESAPSPIRDPPSCPPVNVTFELYIPPFLTKASGIRKVCVVLKLWSINLAKGH